MDSFRIEWKRSADREIRKIDPLQIRAIIQAVDSLVRDPFPAPSIMFAIEERLIAVSGSTLPTRKGDHRDEPNEPKERDQPDPRCDKARPDPPATREINQIDEIDEIDQRNRTDQMTKQTLQTRQARKGINHEKSFQP